MSSEVDHEDKEQLGIEDDDNEIEDEEEEEEEEVVYEEFEESEESEEETEALEVPQSQLSVEPDPLNEPILNQDPALEPQLKPAQSENQHQTSSVTQTLEIPLQQEVASNVNDELQLKQTEDDIEKILEVPTELKESEDNIVVNAEPPSAIPDHKQAPDKVVINVGLDFMTLEDEKLDVDFLQLEAQAVKVVHDVQNVAKDVSNKIWDAVNAVSSSGRTSNPGSNPALSNITSGISSWLSNLDPTSVLKKGESADRVLASNKASNELQTMFGLSSEENLVEEFKCKLIQTYGCNHNSFTPAFQMAFQGTMFITDQHTCFTIEERGQQLPFKIPHSSVLTASRHKPPRRGDLSDILKLETQGGSWMGFKDFDSGAALDTALALIEHLLESSEGEE